MNQRVFLDTNSLMAIGQHSLSLFEEIERICGVIACVSIFSGTISELKKIQQSSRGKDKLAAKLALQIVNQRVEKGQLAVDDKNGYVDDLLVMESKAGALVVTADLVLQKRLQRPFVVVKQNQYLELKE